MGDYARWCNYCNFMVNTSEGNVSLLGEILWTGESTFTQVGIVKDHNVHYWSLAHIPRTVWHQIHWSINVWCGTWGIQIVGPICYNGNLKIDCYLPLLENMVRDWYEKLPFRNAYRLWFQHFEGPMLKASNVFLYLTTESGQRIVAYGDPVEWPSVRRTWLSWTSTYRVTSSTGPFDWLYFSGRSEAAHHPYLPHSYIWYAPTCP